MNEVVTVDGNKVTLDEWSAVPGKRYLAELPSGTFEYIFTKDGFLEVYEVQDEPEDGEMINAQ